MCFSKFWKNPAPRIEGRGSMQLGEQQLQQRARRVLVGGDRVKECLKVKGALWTIRNLSNFTDKQEGGAGVGELFVVVV